VVGHSGWWFGLGIYHDEGYDAEQKETPHVTTMAWSSWWHRTKISKIWI
jgi:hypothetical protein